MPHRALPVLRYVLLFLALCASAVASHVHAALPDLIKRTKPSIVAIGTYDKLRSPAFAMKGTGFAVGNGNFVATNAHVVPEKLDESGNESLIVRFPIARGEAQQRVARVVATDRVHDLAVLRIEGPPLPPLTLRTTGMVEEGQEVAFMGFPIGGVLGLSVVTHRAIISAITPIALPGGAAGQLNERVITRLKAGVFDVYQLDGTAYPGNSGGPMLHVDTGEVVGIINMVFVKGTKESTLSQPSGISFAIPVGYLQELLKNIPQ